MARPDTTPAPLPTGSYLQTAQGVSMDAGAVVGSLQREDGSWTPARVELDPPTFANLDGVFVYSETWATLSARLGGAAPGAGGASTLSSIGTAAAAIGGAMTGASGDTSGDTSGAGVVDSLSSLVGGG